MLMTLQTAFIRLGSDGLPAPISVLISGLATVNSGHKHPLFLPECDTAQTSDRFGLFDRAQIRGSSAALVQRIIELEGGNQKRACERVAVALRKGGFYAPGREGKAPKADWETVKKWHRRAKSGRSDAQDCYERSLEMLRSRSNLEDVFDWLTEICKLFRLE
jgi:hypothetical protein